MTATGGHWEPCEVRGLRIWRDASGRRTFHIRQSIRGQRYEIATGATNIASALEQLRRFQADPEGYDPRGEAPREGLFLTDELVQEYLAFSKSEGNSVGWRRKQKNILAWWADRLEGIDLRKVSLLDHVLPPLKGATSRHHRTAILKGLYTWLRTEVHRVTTAEDPVFGQLKVPQARAAQLTKSKVVPRDHVLLVIENLTAPWRDALTLQAGTGWHTTEIVRFAAEGTIEPLPRHVQQEGVAGVVVCPMRKSGEPQRTRVSAEALEAAKRLRAHAERMAKVRAENKAKIYEARVRAAGGKPAPGRRPPDGFSREWYDRAVRAACAVVKRPDGGTGIPPFTPGRLRHSVATWAIDAGADPAQVAAFLGHRSPRTTRKFYATHSAPTKVPTLA
ncbi:integrase family protein [Anaeromyxobacter sp. K]|uniref:tyrosine-type recombinase/integrase n=1 Tax=Anaeromyxobacter sp. (strain K) TaxID=447217 RepID=UPI00015F8913|nr:tyrosine-type recombinase/integrase [Anaeromyxobacter sp. K]ACG73253.1 integrase family protein [Anaeromyxobacter sp. K]